jgi:hypothetical protein
MIGSVGPRQAEDAGEQGRAVPGLAGSRGDPGVPGEACQPYGQVTEGPSPGAFDPGAREADHLVHEREQFGGAGRGG